MQPVRHTAGEGHLDGVIAVDVLRGALGVLEDGGIGQPKGCNDDQAGDGSHYDAHLGFARQMGVVGEGALPACSGVTLSLIC